MSRHQTRRTWSAKLPDGRTVKGIIPDVIVSRQAIKLVSKLHHNNAALAGKEAMDNQLRLCLTSIGGRAVSFAMLRGAGLSHHLSQKEQMLVGEALAALTQPTEGELEAFRESLVMSREADAMKWEGLILLGRELEEYARAKSDIEFFQVRIEQLTQELGSATCDALKDDMTIELELAKEQLQEALVEFESQNWGVTVSGVVPSTNEMKEALERVPRQLREYVGLQAKESQENLLRACVTNIDGKDVSFNGLKEDELDAWLSPKEQHLIIVALGELSTPDEDEKHDFLESLTLE